VGGLFHFRQSLMSALGAKRTRSPSAVAAAFDPKRTSRLRRIAGPLDSTALARAHRVRWERLVGRGRLVIVVGIILAVMPWRPMQAQPLKTDPTPYDYVERNSGGATVVPYGQLVIDGHRMVCGTYATVIDPNLNDYAAAPYRQFIILNMPYIAKVPIAVKLWIYSHECGHKFVGTDENKADCYAVRRGRSEGWLDASGLEEVCQFISAARPDALHASGPDRCELMRECYRQAAPKPAAAMPSAPK
jgi:hypothetical protein